MNVIRTVRLLVLTNCITSVALGALLVSGYKAQNGKFAEIDAERINIVGESGKPVLVLSNRARIPGPSMNGKTYSRSVSDGREYLSGMIFFNDEGDEVGGLIFNGFKKKDGYSSVGHLSFDQYKQNQVVALQYIDGGKSRRAGLNVWDRPTDVSLDKQLDLIQKMRDAKPEDREKFAADLKASNERGESGVQRLFVGSQDKAAQVQLRDTKGRVRIRMIVDEKDDPRLEFLSAAGKVVKTYRD